MDLIALLRLERGDFKLRVRAAELERAEERTRLVQRNLLHGVMSCFFLQAAMSTTVLGKGWQVAVPVTKACVGVALFFAIRVPLGLVKVQKLDKYNEKYGVKR